VRSPYGFQPDGAKSGLLRCSSSEVTIVTRDNRAAPAFNKSEALTYLQIETFSNFFSPFMTFRSTSFRRASK
jgi:hypothetical protein